MSKPETLFDSLQIAANSKRSVLHYLSPTLRRARCFLLDDDMSAFSASLATQAFHEIAVAASLEPVPMNNKTGSGYGVIGTEKEITAVLFKLRKIGEGLRVLSKAPHAVTWIEFDFHKRFDRYLNIFSVNKNFDPKTFKFNHRTAYKKAGWLIEQLTDETYRCLVVMGTPDDDRLETAVSPFSYGWSTSDEPLKFGTALSLEYAGESNDETRDELTSRMCFGTPALAGMAHVLSNELTRIQSMDYLHTSLLEMRGELRYVWALLASINDLPVGIRKVERSRGFMNRRNYQKFMSYSTISLIIPKRMTERRLAKIVVAISRRRAHMVRGHFRLVGADKKKVWIKEHQRGDASLGWVTSNYFVKHKETLQ